METSWDDLRYLLAVSRAGSMSRAAKQLKVAMTTVGRRLDALEQGLGVRLVERSPTGVQLTEAGRLLAEQARGVEVQIAGLERVAQGYQGEVEGEVRVSTIETLAAEVIAPSLPELRRLHPELCVRLMSEQAVVSLARHEADIAIRLGRPQAGSLVARRLATIHFGLYASPSYLARRGRPARPEQGFEGHDWVTYALPEQLVPEHGWMAARAGTRPAAMSTNSVRVLLEGVMAGLGLGVLPTVLAPPGLVRLLGPEVLESRGVWMILHEDSARVARVRVAADHIAREFATRFDGAQGAEGAVSISL
jgi:DNA-binding transcriptional LysR family regulator